MSEESRTPPSVKDDLAKSASPEQPKPEGEGMKGLNVIFGTAGAFVALMSLLVFKGRGPKGPL